MNSKEYLARIKNIASMPEGSTTRYTLEYHLMIDLLTEIRETGGTWSLHAKLFLEMLDGSDLADA